MKNSQKYYLGIASLTLAIMLSISYYTFAKVQYVVPNFILITIVAVIALIGITLILNTLLNDSASTESLENDSKENTQTMLITTEPLENDSKENTQTMLITTEPLENDSKENTQTMLEIQRLIMYYNYRIDNMSAKNLLEERYCEATLCEEIESIPKIFLFFKNETNTIKKVKELGGYIKIIIDFFTYNHKNENYQSIKNVILSFYDKFIPTGQKNYKFLIIGLFNESTKNNCITKLKERHPEILNFIAKERPYIVEPIEGNSLKTMDEKQKTELIDYLDIFDSPHDLIKKIKNSDYFTQYLIQLAKTWPKRIKHFYDNDTDLAQCFYYINLKELNNYVKHKFEIGFRFLATVKAKKIASVPTSSLTRLNYNKLKKDWNLEDSELKLVTIYDEKKDVDDDYLSDDDYLLDDDLDEYVLN